MKNSGIGGEAVIEGIMMRNGHEYSVGVRKPDGDIHVEVKEYKGLVKGDTVYKIPFIRGIFSFLDSLILGVSALTYSGSFYEEEEHEELSEEELKKKEHRDNLVMGITVAFSLVIAVLIFIVVPYGLSALLRPVISSYTIRTIIEGVIRIAIFLIYIWAISRMEDIRRTFMYHGAEHKCINCVEHGLPLTVDNVRISSREHKRCGTSFLVFVVIICIILYLFIRVDSHALRITIRIILIPVIAGLSYELLRAAGRYDNKFIQIISKPGMWVQQLTVSEPDDDMIEVGIASVEAVFDWRSFVKEVRREEGIEVIGEEESDASDSAEESASDTKGPPAEEETAEEVAEENPAGIDASRDEEFWL